MSVLKILPLAILLYAAPAGALTFDEAEKAMLSSNPQAVSARLDLEASRARLSSARAGLYPAFSATASYSREGSRGVPAGDSYSYGVSGSQALFSPSLPAAVRTAKAAERAAGAVYDRVASDLRYQLKSAFADIINARETISLSEETLKRRAENLELIRLKYQAGRENKAALLETEAALKTSRWEHDKYRTNLRLLERKLNRLLGLAALTPVPDLELPLPPEPPEDLSAFSSALENHYSLRSARAAMDSAGYAVDSAKGARLPQAAATGSYAWNGTAWPYSRSTWSLGASLSLPLFSGGRLSSDLSAAESAKHSAGSALKNVSDEVYLNAEDAFLSWREARSYVDVAKSSLDAAEARAWLVRKQYLAGQSSYFEWRNVEEQFISWQNQYLAAGRALEVSHAAFIRAIGE